jgi:DNA (cytosine-5)-methyltransferase 1
VDNIEQPFRVLEWCAGYGGIGMGLKRVVRNMRTIAYSEIELFGCEILESRMENGQIDPAPIWSNIKSFPCERFRGMVDCLIAGYPCQPFSTAGQRQGEEDEKGRHLWPHLQRSIAIIRPRFCFFENVAGHLTLGLGDVLHDLSELGFEVTAGLFEARAEGLPHKRQRLFILAHDKSAGTRLDERQLRRQFNEADGEGFGVGLADSSSERRERGSRPEQGGPSSPASGRGDGAGIDLAPAGPGSEQYWWEPARVLGNEQREKTESRGQPVTEIITPLGGSPDGSTDRLDGPDLLAAYHALGSSVHSRTDELRALGNGVIPAVSATAFLTLYDELTK